MSKFWIVFLIILVVLIAALVALYFWGKKMEKKQAENEQQMAQVAQTVTMMVIDKKMMRIKDANLPSIVYENTPWYMKRSKVPIVKAKVGPQIMTLMCDTKVYPVVPVGGKPIKAVVSGIYITDVKGIRGSLEKPAEKKKFLDRFRRSKKNK